MLPIVIGMGVPVFAVIAYALINSDRPSGTEPVTDYARGAEPPRREPVS
jgi:hypothetical protein